MSAPRIAVIVPCFNDGPLARDAVASVQAQEPAELVIVDDASTEADTATALAELARTGVRVIRHDANAGLSAARMTGLRATTARFVFPLDSDDLLAPGALTALSDRLDADPALAVVFADYREFGSVDRVVRVPDRLDPFRVAYRNSYPVASLFRRSALEAAGGWRDVAGLIGYEDWHLWMTLAERGERGERLPSGEIALVRRTHSGRMLADAGRQHRELYAHLRRLHPELFAQLRRYRRETDLPWPQRMLYPALFGARPPLGLWSRVRAVRGRTGRSRQDEGS